jgi:hypothetical protein
LKYEVEINAQNDITAHIVKYPKSREGEFISLSLMKFGEILDRTKDWDLKSPYIESNELFMKTNLTENDLVIRQINVAKIIDRIIRERIKEVKKNPEKIIDKTEFKYEIDFYGKSNYWFKLALPLKFITFVYFLLYIPYRLSIFILSIFSPLDQFNTVL